MSSIQETADQIKDILTVCMAKGVDAALSDAIGPKWFEYFKQQDSQNKREYRIVRPENNSVYDFDFQALLKLMKFNMDLRIYILSFFHPEEQNIDTVYGKNSLFDNLLYRLMTLYRNQIAAHKKARDIEDNQASDSSSTTYSYYDAISDMKKLAYNFKSVTDKNGVSYYDAIDIIIENYIHESKKSFYSIHETIRAEQLDISISDFIQICSKSGIHIISDSKDTYFSTDNYSDTITTIKNRIQLHQAEAKINKEKNKKILIISGLLTVAILFIVISIVLIIKLSRNDSNPVYTVSYEHTEPDTENKTESTTANKPVSTFEQGLTDAQNNSTENNSTEDNTVNEQNDDVFSDIANFTPEAGQIILRPKKVEYYNDGIKANLYLVNGTDKYINSIILKEVKLSINGASICDAVISYETDQDAPATISVNLAPGDHTEVGPIIFSPETINKDDIRDNNLHLKDIDDKCWCDLEVIYDE